MMKRIMKSAITMFLTFIMCISTITFVNASTVPNVIKDNTIVTSENLMYVLSYLNIEPLSIRHVSSNNAKVTVKELRGIVKQTLPHKTCVNENTICSGSGIILSKNKAEKGTIKCTYTSKQNSFDVTFIVNGNYYKKGKTHYWTSIKSTNAKFKDKSFIELCHNKFRLVYQKGVIKNPKSNNSYILLNTKYVVTTVIDIGVFEIEIGESIYNNKNYFYGNDWI